MGELVARWARFYTRGLCVPVASRRVAEIDADLHDHIAHERAGGVDDRRIARDIASRMVRGLAADLAWRGRQVNAAPHTSTREDAMTSRRTVARSAVRIALVVALVLSVPFAAMQITGEVVWSLGDFVAAGVFLAIIGITLELAVRKAGNRAAAAGLAVLGVAAAVFGNADDAPGLVLLGLLLIASACALGVRRAQRGRKAG
jgi:hypothetical protein